MSRIRTNLITNRMANGAPTVSNGLVISGVTTVTTLDLNGDLDVDGHLNVDNVSVSGISTFSDAVRIVKTAGPLLELTTNTGAADATLRLSEGATGSTTNGGGMFYSGADNKLHITCGTNSTTKRITINRDDGNVGINSTNPSAPLEIYTAASSAWKFRIDTTVSDGVGFYQRANGDFELVLRDASNNVNYILGTSGGLNFVTSNTEKVKITNSSFITTPTLGHALFGTETARSINSHQARLQVTGTTFSHSTVSIVSNTNGADGAYLFLGKQRSGAIGGSTAVQADDIIGQVRFLSGDGTDLESSAGYIEMKADANATSNTTPGYLQFFTTRRNGSSGHFKARFHQNDSHGTLFSFGTETNKINNSTNGDRTSFKIGPATHIEGVFGNNGTAGLYYNCYSGGNDLFYRGTEAPSAGDWRPCAYGQKYGSHYFYSDPSNTAYSAQAQITTMQTNMHIAREGWVLKANHPSFRANRETTSVDITATAIQQWNNTSGASRSFDRYTTGGYGFNTSTYKYKVPVTGVWYFHASVYTNAGQSCMFDIRTSTQILQRAEDNSGSNMPNNNIVHSSVVVICNKDDEVYVNQSGGQCQMIAGSGYISFDGYLIA